jgi:hypothetical protein
MSNVFKKALILTLALIGITSWTLPTKAQEIQTLLDWDSNWRYVEDGSDLGTAWREFDYPAENDAPWSAPSPGILAFEDQMPIEYTVTAAINTTLAVSMVVTTFYFRASFNFSGPTSGLILVATNVMDDGSVIYLNGTEVGRFRVPPNQNAATFATASPAVEGMIEPLAITNVSLLRQGQNVMAVEVHQITTNSSDIAWGTKLVAIRPTPMTITSQPKSQVAIVGQPLSLTVGVSGGPAFYRWFRTGSQAVLGTNASFNITSAQIAQSGDYYVVITNSLSVLTSQVATVSVLVDTVGPVPIDARGDTNTFAPKNAQVITIRFPTTDPLHSSATNAANFAVYAGTDFNTRVTFTNVTYTSTQGPRLNLWMSGPGWVVGNNYFVVLNNIADTRGNLIAPNTRVPVSWPIVTNLVLMSDSWAYYDQGDTAPEIYTATPAWNATNYVQSGLWQTGNGIFWHDDSGPGVTPCAGETLNTPIELQTSPVLFRRTINVPAAYAATANLHLRFMVDDGMLFYLNGQEVYAYNARSNRGPVKANETSIAVTNSVCVTNVVISGPLLPGNNWLAAAVIRGYETPVDTYFGLAVEGQFLKTSPVPADPPANQLVLTSTRAGDGVQLSWPTAFGGCSLQYKTNLNAALPWITVSNQANPYNVSVGDTRLYRLQKVFP